MRVFILALLAIIIVVPLLRVLIGGLTRGLADLLSGGGGGQTPQRPPAGGGELKKDPVCGTYVAAATSLKKTVDGKVVHFCSPECRDRYT